eukprot:CAMPEP_0171525858 /NCGR_PEP_ID=MMETSP0959-20130129/10013_1 /TAXON_ID=87120 /ORGANISM="Aurantiochytrium limacinum, Strain ATCCMYA-1381" /LENGTH=373 /DNA_ID=CAMNT_0012067101 /DNA_START=160 /DNA_END=1281 /DNA_ORIENTATION=-
MAMVLADDGFGHPANSGALTVSPAGAEVPTKPLWEHVVPAATCCKLLPGSALTGLPVSLCVGTSSGRLQIWGEDDAQHIAQHSMNDSISCISVLTARQELPVIAAGDNSGNVGMFRLQALGDDADVGDMDEDSDEGADRSGASQPLVNLGRLDLYDSCTTTVAMNPFRSGVAASGSEDGRMNMLYLGETLQTDGIRSEDSACVNDIVFWTPDAIVVAGSNPGGLLRTWDARAPDSMQVLPGAVGANARMTSLAVHPSVPYQLACGDDAGGISLWDLRTGRCAGRHVTHQETVTSLVYHPDRPQVLLSASDDGMVRALNTHFPRESMQAPLYSFNGLACTGIDVCGDELSGPLLMAAGENETVTLTPLYQILRM